MDVIHFDPFVSRVESGFWHELAQRKLEKYKLSEAEQVLGGCYSNGEQHTTIQDTHSRTVILALK